MEMEILSHLEYFRIFLIISQIILCVAIVITNLVAGLRRGRKCFGVLVRVLECILTAEPWSFFSTSMAGRSWATVGPWLSSGRRWLFPDGKQGRHAYTCTRKRNEAGACHSASQLQYYWSDHLPCVSEKDAIAGALCTGQQVFHFSGYYWELEKLMVQLSTGGVELEVKSGESSEERIGHHIIYDDRAKGVT